MWSFSRLFRVCEPQIRRATDPTNPLTVLFWLVPWSAKLMEPFLICFSWRDGQWTSHAADAPSRWGLGPSNANYPMLPSRSPSILLVHHVSQTYFCIELSELLGNVCWDYSSWAVFHSRVRVEVVFQYDAVIPDSSGQFRPLHDILPRTSEIRWYWSRRTRNASSTTFK